VADARERVAQAIKASGLRYTIFRPTGYFNDISYLFESAAKKGVVNLYGLPNMRINPSTRSILARKLPGQLQTQPCGMSKRTLADRRF
jgi:uncharacterized protein YbjT (DUF2867 family)